MTSRCPPGAAREPGRGDAIPPPARARSLSEVCHGVGDDRRTTAQKVQVAALVRLQDVLLVQTAIAAHVLALRRRPCRTPPLQLGIVDEHVEGPRLDVEPDPVPGPRSG